LKKTNEDLASTRDQMHTLSLEIKQKHSDASKEKLETQELHKHDSKLASAETQLKTNQSNVSQRVSYAVHEINELSKSQRKTNEELKQAKESIEVICEAERQLLDEVGKNKGHCAKNVLQRERNYEAYRELCRYNANTVTGSKGCGQPTHNPSDFTADVKYHAKEYHCETRKWLFDAIEQWRTQSTAKVKLSLVTGNPGMGKSVLASQLCTIANGKGVLAACFFFQHHKARRNNPKILVQTLAYQLCFANPQYKDQIENYLIEEELLQMNVFELFTDLVLKPLHNVQDVSEQKLIIIDGLDECDFEERGDLLKLILREFVKLPEWIGVIMTTRPDQKILRKLSRIKSVFELNPDDPRNITDIKLYLRDILKERMQIVDLESGLEIMVKKSEGMFLYFHYASEAILEHDTLTLDHLNSLLPDGIDDFYEQNFRRLYSKLGKEKYSLLFQAITAARSEFPKALIGPLLNVSDAESSKIIDTVSVLLPVHNGYVNMFHKSIRDWLNDRDLAEDLAIESTPGHSNVADICYEEFKTIKMIAPPERELVQNPVTKYAIEHTVYHMCSADKHSLSAKLCHIVTDLQYMFYKLLLSRSANDLMDDLSEAKKAVSKSPLHSQMLQHCIIFVHRYAQTLRSMPQMVFQCALNDPQDFASHICLEQYRDNPAQYFPGLELYLELMNKPQSPATAITEYHCENQITSLTKSPDGKLLVCSDTKGKIYIWDKNTGDLLQEEVIKDRDLLFPIVRCSVSADGNTILYGNLAEALSIDGAIVPFFSNATPDPWEINTCIFSPSGKFVVAWTYVLDGIFRFFAETEMNVALKFTVQIWDSDQALSTTLEHVTRKEVRPLCACISRDSKFIACGHRDGRIILWETSTKEPISMLLSDGTTIRKGPFKSSDSPEDNPVIDIAYSINGHYLAASYNKGITIWDAASLNFIQNLLPSNEMLKVYTNAKFRCFSFSAGLSNGHIHVWTKHPGPEGAYALQLSNKPHGSSDPVTECFFDDDQNIVCAVRSSICIYAYDSLLKYHLQLEYFLCMSNFKHPEHSLWASNGIICGWQTGSNVW
jgi:WD40 repeat protein